VSLFGPLLHLSSQWWLPYLFFEHISRSGVDEGLIFSTIFLCGLVQVTSGITLELLDQKARGFVVQIILSR
jgi:hypothetical protein